MVARGSQVRGPNVLLLSDDEAWRTAAAAATGAFGAASPTVTRDPAETLHALLAANRGYTHLMVDVRSAAGWRDVFTGLTVEEAESETALVWLGTSDSEASGIPCIRHPDAAAMAGLLTAHANRAAVSPATLSSSEIMRAMQEGRVNCRFQPIVRIDDRKPVGLEALARLDHPVRGMLPPGQFVPQLEQAGLSLDLTEAVFDCFVSQISSAFLEAHELFVSINLPLDAFLLPKALSQIEMRRRDAGMPASRVLIELTESRPVSDLAALADALDRWRRVGYRLAIDDLGPDVMNQTSLIGMKFNAVKLDKQIVSRSRIDPLANRYLQRTVADARAHALTVIAEGIEDASVWQAMAAMGVEQAQGFMIARALPAAVLPAWFEVWTAAAAV